jgi:hypothetical protein
LAKEEDEFIIQTVQLIGRKMEEISRLLSRKNEDRH